MLSSICDLLNSTLIAICEFAHSTHRTFDTCLIWVSKIFQTISRFFYSSADKIIQTPTVQNSEHVGYKSTNGVLVIASNMDSLYKPSSYNVTPLLDSICLYDLYETPGMSCVVISHNMRWLCLDTRCIFYYMLCVSLYVVDIQLYVVDSLIYYIP